MMIFMLYDKAKRDEICDVLLSCLTRIFIRKEQNMAWTRIFICRDCAKLLIWTFDEKFLIFLKIFQDFYWEHVLIWTIDGKKFLISCSLGGEKLPSH